MTHWIVAAVILAVVLTVLIVNDIRYNARMERFVRTHSHPYRINRH